MYESTEQPRIALWLAAASILVVVGVAMANYRSAGSSERIHALESLRMAVATLDSPAAERAIQVSRYGERLGAAEASLQRALTSYPLDSTSIQRLAAVRWELGALRGTRAGSVLALVNLATARAPRNPNVQADLGALLYKMGMPDDAAKLMARSVTLSPAITNHVVATMLDLGVEPEDVLGTLPKSAALMLAVKESFASANQGAAWLDHVESLLPSDPRELLVAYTDICLANGEVDRLLVRTQQLGMFTDKTAEAERQIAIGRAQLASNNRVAAGLSAEAGRALSPTDPHVLELTGQIALLAGDFSQAELAFRDALSALVRSSVQDEDRARLYRERGQALEALNRFGDAFEDYRRAAELNPDDPWLRGRFGNSAIGDQPGGRP